ncbi:MAG: hypothetical protein GEV11_22745 [Streptosporangiales bacterium]|nr:hypothetical protein [Streptosporangiales bacterium]
MTNRDPSAARVAEARLTELAGLLSFGTGRMTMIRTLDGRIRPAPEGLRPPTNRTDPVRARRLYDLLRDVEPAVFAPALTWAARARTRRHEVTLVAIKLGIPGSVDPMIGLLHHYHSTVIAEDYLNSGSSALAAAARAWAYRNGYEIHYSKTGGAAQWGIF